MRIIVEGPDGAGKTHLVDYLRELFDLSFIRNDMGPDQNLEWWWPETLVKQTPTTPIHDRFFYSELVYGPVIRGYLKVPEDLINQIAAGLRREALLIYARPSREALELGVREHDQMKGVTDKFTELVEAYDRLMNRESLAYGNRFYLFNWLGTFEPRQVVEHVQRYLRGDLE